jgi:hypothetical protein
MKTGGKMMKFLKRFPNRVLFIMCLIVLVIMSGCFMFDLRITTNSLPDGTVGVYYNAWVHANQWVDDWVISSGSLPPGISFNDDGHFYGTPTTAGTYPITIEAIQYGSGGDHAYKGFSITIHP